MTDQKFVINFSSFKNEYKEGRLNIYVVKSTAKGFLKSEYANNGYKWLMRTVSWSGGIVTVPLTIYFFLIDWKLAILTFFVGLFIIWYSEKLAGKLVLSNMLNDEDFWDFILLHRGAKMVGEDEKEYISEFLYKAVKK